MDVDKLLMKKRFNMDQIYANVREEFLIHKTPFALSALRTLALYGHDEAKWVMDVVDRNGGEVREEMAEWFLCEEHDGRTLCFAAILMGLGDDRCHMLLEKSAIMGYPYGMTKLGEYATAFFWVLKAAEAHDARGQFWLGWCYEYGLGVTRDNAKALLWMQMSASNGYHDGMRVCGDYCASAGNLLQCIYWYGECLAIGGYPCHFPQLAVEIMKKYDSGDNTPTALSKIVYALGKAVALDAIDSKLFGESTNEQMCAMNRARELFQERKVVAQHATFAWLCICRFSFGDDGVRFPYDVVRIIAMMIWDVRDEGRK